MDCSHAIVAIDFWIFLVGCPQRWESLGSRKSAVYFYWGLPGLVNVYITMENHHV